MKPQEQGDGQREREVSMPVIGSERHGEGPRLVMVKIGDEVDEVLKRRQAEEGGQ